MSFVRRQGFVRLHVRTFLRLSCVFVWTGCFRKVLQSWKGLTYTSLERTLIIYRTNSGILKNICCSKKMFREAWSTFTIFFRFLSSCYNEYCLYWCLEETIFVIYDLSEANCSVCMCQYFAVTTLKKWVIASPYREMSFIPWGWR